MMLKKNIELSELTTFKIGGPASYFIETADLKEVREAILFAVKNKLKLFILGGGSDILVKDEGISGVVIKYINDEVRVKELKTTSLVTAGAGLPWDDFVKKTVEMNLQGIECMSGIPGSCGAAPVQNIGAYGQELKDCFYSLKALELETLKTKTFKSNDCKFGYRESIFKSPSHWQKYLITEITLKLKKGSIPDVKYASLTGYLSEKGLVKPTLQEIREAVLNIRNTKFENYHDSPNAGSFFKNPTIDKNLLEKLLNKYPEMPYFDNNNGTYKCFAGWFIEKAEWKGKKYKNAQVSSKHALILLNPERSAKAEDVLKLADLIVDDVQSKFDIKLEKEVQYINI